MYPVGLGTSSLNKFGSVSKNYGSRSDISKTNTYASQSVEQKSQSQGSKNSKLPYIVGGAAVLAASAFVFRKHLKNLIKPLKNQKTKTPLEISKITDETAPAIDSAKLPALKQNEKFALKPEVRSEIMGERKEFKDLNLNIKPTAEQESKNEVASVVNKESAPVAETKTPVLKQKDESVKLEAAKTEVEGQFIKPVTVCTGFDQNNKPIYVQVEGAVDSFAPARSVFSETLESIDLNNEKVISKIEHNRTKEKDNISRIIGENIKDGHVNIPMMKKIAGDYMNDINRGADRFHQAADILEQSYIREFVKGDSKLKSGMYNFTDCVTTDPVLYKCYTSMPVEEAAGRLNYLKERDLKSGNFAEGMTPEKFFEKAFNRLVEKIQFKKYNEAHAISS